MRQPERASLTPSDSTRTISQSFQRVVGLRTDGVLEKLLEHAGEPYNAFSLIWVVGPAASGKSVVASFLHQAYPDVPVIHDRHALTQQLRARFGSAPQSTLPALVDVALLTDALDSVVMQASQLPRGLVELGRGGSEHSLENPMSFAFALGRIPEHTLQRSLFVYLKAPFDLRVARNSSRPIAQSEAVGLIPEVRCSDDTMQCIFRDDDVEHLLTHPKVTFLEFNNTGSKQELVQALGLLFGRRR